MKKIKDVNNENRKSEKVKRWKVKSEWWKVSMEGEQDEKMKRWPHLNSQTKNGSISYFNAYTLDWTAFPRSKIKQQIGQQLFLRQTCDKIGQHFRLKQSEIKLGMVFPEHGVSIFND